MLNRYFWVRLNGTDIKIDFDLSIDALVEMATKI